MKNCALTTALILHALIAGLSLAHSADAKVPKYQILRQLGAEGQFVVPDREMPKQYIAMFR